METLTGEHIQARLAAGLSYADIGREADASKDKVRGIHKRWLATQVSLADLIYPSSRVLADAGVTADSVKRDVPATIDAIPALNFGWYDLEATNLNGSFGSLLAGCCNHADGSIFTVRIDDPKLRDKKDPTNDRALAAAMRDHLESHDIIFSWNGRRGMNPKGRGGFDVPMLNARLVPDRILKSDSRTHIDLLPVARRHLQLHSYRLAAVQEFLELQEEKSAILPNIWRRALQHDKEAMDFVVDHCQRDVRVLQEVFWQFLRAGLISIGVTVARS